jgi:hypothetical protein
MIDRDRIKRTIKGKRGKKKNIILRYNFTKEYKREKIEKKVQLGKRNKSPNRKGE